MSLLAKISFQAHYTALSQNSQINALFNITNKAQNSDVLRDVHKQCIDQCQFSMHAKHCTVLAI